LRLVGHTPLSIDADPIRIRSRHEVFLYRKRRREAKTPYCLISVVDAGSGKKLEDIKLDTKPLESMALEKNPLASFRQYDHCQRDWSGGPQDTRLSYDLARYRRPGKRGRCSTMNPRIAYLQLLASLPVGGREY